MAAAAVFGFARSRGLDPEALSRVAPVAMYFFAHPAAAPERARAAARPARRRRLTACRALAQALHAALSGDPARDPGAAQSVSMRRCTRCRLAAATTPGCTRRGAGSLCQHREFRDAVLSAANLGGNSMWWPRRAAAAPGAHYTASAIPTLWRTA